MELFGLWAIMAFVTAMVGSSRGGSGVLYFVAGLLCWPIALVHALLRKAPNAQADDRQGGSKSPAGRIQNDPARLDFSGLSPIAASVASAPPIARPPVIEGVISGVPFWRSGGHIAAQMSGKELHFPSLEMLMAALSGGDHVPPIAAPPNNYAVEPAIPASAHRIAGMQPSEWRLDYESDGFVTVGNGVVQKRFASMAVARAWVGSQERGV